MLATREHLSHLGFVAMSVYLIFRNCQFLNDFYEFRLMIWVLRPLDFQRYFGHTRFCSLEKGILKFQRMLYYQLFTIMR